jgi:GNAT superfamily N-acetyltransferase
MTAIRVRDATTQDARAIAVVHVRTWQEAYRGLVPDEFLDSLDIERRIAAYAEHGTIGDAGSPLYVAEADDNIVGFSKIGPSPDEDGVGEVGAIYVRAAHWDTGAGRELMRTSLDWLGPRFRESTLWVLAENDRARRFYEKGGWRFDGTTKDDDRGSFVLREVRYRITHRRKGSA